uniref:Putative ovule protein n=1 Tax=Solanum chacoense TaxID=4108 RepID=A0A0V0GXK8_SOLCH
MNSSYSISYSLSFFSNFCFKFFPWCVALYMVHQALGRPCKGCSTSYYHNLHMGSWWWNNDSKIVEHLWNIFTQ